MPRRALMPPKGILRPAAAGKGRARPRAKAVAKAKAALRRVRRGLRRPAAGREEKDLGEEEVSVTFEEGGEVAAHRVGLAEWKIGQKVVVTEGIYWEEKVKICGVLRELRVGEGENYLALKLEGTQSEALVRWAGGHPGMIATVHLCPPECAKMSKDGLIHALKVKKWKAEERDAWMDNLVEAGRPSREDVDELSRVRERARHREEERIGEPRAPMAEAEKVSSSGSSEAKKKRKKKKKRKRKEDTKRKITGTKDLAAVFGTTALDPSPTVRRYVKERGGETRTARAAVQAPAQGRKPRPRR